MQSEIRQLLPFVERPPTSREVETLRLILSTFQDGSGMLSVKRAYDWMEFNNSATLPGWRDFERAVALVFGGSATESKYIYDVLLQDDTEDKRVFGLSCKMRKEYIRKAVRSQRGSIELSNAAGEFWAFVKTNTDLNEVNYVSDIATVGRCLVSVVEHWHELACVANGGIVQAELNSILNLLWDEPTGIYQLFQFPTCLPNPSELRWEASNRSIKGYDAEGVVLEWYPFSGGQLKFYPPIRTATWISDVFKLEPLPGDLKHVLKEKAASYFPTKWNVE